MFYARAFSLNLNKDIFFLCVDCDYSIVLLTRAGGNTFKKINSGCFHKFKFNYKYRTCQLLQIQKWNVTALRNSNIERDNSINSNIEHHL